MRRVGSKIVANPLAVARRYTANKVTRAEDVAHLVNDGATISVGGFVATGCPEAVLEALGNRFLAEGHPKDLTLIFEGGPGDWASRGLNHLAKEGMVRRSFGAHYGQVPMLGKLAIDNKIEAYNLPMGSISRMLRAAASGGPGHLTEIGFHTLVDPANGGGKLNDRTPDFVKIVELEGKRYLFFPAIPVDVGIVRGTTADGDGNLTLEKEALLADHFVIAQAAATHRGISIAQVERIASVGTLDIRKTFIPGAIIDAVVVAPPEKHHQSFVTVYNPAVSGEIRKPSAKHQVTSELDIRKTIARRAAMELAPDYKVNLGIGMPEGVAKVVAEERLSAFVNLSTEAGAYGGIGLSGHDFGGAENPDCLIQLHQQFDFYNGGGLDCCFLGAGEIDELGNVNVTRLGTKLTGPGGFIDISQATPRVNLLGTFTAGGKIKIEDGKVKIIQEGNTRKFVKSVREVTFSGKRAIELNQTVRYITERCVFELKPNAETALPELHLTEIAPGIDLDRDVLKLMDFAPVMRQPPQLMKAFIFDEKPMNLRALHFVPRMSDRVNYFPTSNTLFVNLSHVTVNADEIMDDLFDTMKRVVQDTNQCDKVHIVVNYNGFQIDPDFVEEYQSRVKAFNSKCALTTKRFSSRAFRQHALQQALNIQEGDTEEVRRLLRQLEISSPATDHSLEVTAPGRSAEELDALLVKASRV